MLQALTRPTLLNGRLALRWHHAAVLAIATLAALLYTYDLGENGYGNEYYAAATLSMSQDLKAFFFGSLDSSNFITVDKPAPALWLNAVSVKAFGLNSWSLVLPQAAASVGSVLVLYATVGRRFGRLAGLVAALTLAITPAAVATTRTNMPDALLVFLLVCSGWAASRAIEGGRIAWVVMVAVFVGLAFNVKMLQAYIVVPGLVLAYAVAAPLTWKARAARLALAGTVLLAVSASWVTVVDLWPKDSRPYVGGSENNTVRDLVFGYNGLGRVFGEEAAGGPGDGPAPKFGGEPGWDRLFNAATGGQIGWLLPFAGVGGMAGLAWRGRDKLSDARRGDILLWGGWSLAHFVVFSWAAGIFHPYYTSALAPGVAALVGIGASAMARTLRTPWWHSAFLPVALGLTAWAELYLLSRARNWNEWLPLLVAGLTTGAAIVYLAARFLPSRLGGKWPAYGGPAAAGLGVAAVLVAPGLWGAATLSRAGGGPDPLAGPASSLVGGGPLAPGLRPGSTEAAPGIAPATAGGGQPPRPAAVAPASPEGANSKLIAYLEANRGDAKWLVAVTSANQAAPLIIASREPVMAMGGFSGGDPAPTVDQLARLVQAGDLRFVMAGGAPRGGAAEISAWVLATCTPVNPVLYLGSTERAGSAVPSANAPGPGRAASPGYPPPEQAVAVAPGGASGFLFDCAK